jgi:hypothetical protein
MLERVGVEEVDDIVWRSAFPTGHLDLRAVYDLATGCHGWAHTAEREGTAERGRAVDSPIIAVGQVARAESSLSACAC